MMKGIFIQMTGLSGAVKSTIGFGYTTIDWVRVSKLHPSFTSSKKIEEDITKVFQKLETKKEYLDQHVEIDDIPSFFDVKQWTTFLLNSNTYNSDII